MSLSWPVVELISLLSFPSFTISFSLAAAADEIVMGKERRERLVLGLAFTSVQINYRQPSEIISSWPFLSSFPPPTFFFLFKKNGGGRRKKQRPGGNEFQNPRGWPTRKQESSQVANFFFPLKRLAVTTISFLRWPTSLVLTSQPSVLW